MTRKCGNITRFVKQKIKDDNSLKNNTNFIIDFHDFHDLTTNDWLNIDILLNIFEPFFEATKMLAGRKYATLSMS